ncbi:MAG TPA: PepSY-like domain-containing protein [Chitinophagaceae bacterium]|nr:PepSY-like domain-containing protein [Chitinophagaceae bacterium]
MKLKTFLALAVIVFLTACSSTYRATDRGIVVSTDASRAFELQYPAATNIIWSSYDPNVVILNDWDMAGWTLIDADDYVVRFDMDNEKYYAWYDSNGEWIGTAYVVNDYTTLPDMVRSTIKSKYPGYTISSVNKEFHKDRIAYEIVLKDGDTKQVVLMDLNGVVLKSKMK